MLLEIDSVLRPNNEAVVTPSYSPIYDFTRRVEAIRVRWEIMGRVVNFPVATAAITNREVTALYNAFTAPRPRLALLYDDMSPTPFVMDPANCMQGPYLVDFGFPTEESDVYVTGLSYRAVFESVQYVRRNTDLLEFDEEISEDQGGMTYVYAGGAVNLPERQTAFQNRTFKYVQSGSAVGLLAYPKIPPPIWPFAQMSAPRITTSSPQFKGRTDTHFRINWEYVFEWHAKLIGTPHRAPPAFQNAN